MGAKRITESGYENISSFPSMIIVYFFEKGSVTLKEAYLFLVSGDMSAFKMRHCSNTFSLV